MRLLTLIGVFLRVGVMNELHYRVNFFVQLFQSAIALVTALAVLGLVFGHTTDLSGWSHAELLAVMGVHILMGGVIRTLIQPNMNRLMEGIRDGTFDFVLTKPEDAQVLASVREVRIWQAVDVIIGAVVLGVALFQLGGGVGLASALAFGAALVLGALMIYCFWLTVTIGAFWIVRLDEVHELFEGIYQAGRWPVGIYPGWLRIGLTFLVPLAFAITVPAEALTGRLTPETLLVAVVFAGLLLVFTRWWWRFGLKHYSGASA
jgi:ABC-2 type transport system permease protein